MFRSEKVFAVFMVVLAVCTACVFCFSSCDLSANGGCDCDCGCESCMCNHDGNGETSGTTRTYRFEAEDAELYADETEMALWLDSEVYQGGYIIDAGLIFDVQEDETASGGKSVGYFAHDNPTVTYRVTSDVATTATLTLRAASCDVIGKDMSSVFSLFTAGINRYSGAGHDILTVNGASVTLSGTLDGSDSVFRTVVDDDGNIESGIAVNNWGELTAEVSLKEGANEIVLTHDGAGVNFDYIELETTAYLTFDKTDNSGFTYLPDGGHGSSDEESDPVPDPDPIPGDDDEEPDPGPDPVIENTYRFEAENARLYADEAEMVYWLEEDVFQGSYITGMGFILKVQEDETASGEMSVGYLAHNNPTVTYFITSDIATTATLTLGAASCDINTEGISSVFGLMAASINDYAGEDHDILKVNGGSVALTGTLKGSPSVFSTDGLAMNNWGELTAEIELIEGVNVIVLTHDGAGVNFDYIELTTTAELTFVKTDNSDFTYLPNGEYVPGTYDACYIATASDAEDGMIPGLRRDRRRAATRPLR